MSAERNPPISNMPETPAMDHVPTGADEFAGEPVLIDEHDLNEESFLDSDPEDVALDPEAA